MPKVLDACPSDRIFAKLAQNELSAKDRQLVLDHIGECDDCSRRANAASYDAALVNPDQKAKTAPDPGSKKLAETLRQAWSEKTQDKDAAKTRRTTKKSDRPFDFLAPPQQKEEIGRLGSYRALKVLGAGGMGVVFRAEDVKLRRQVALKVMLPGIAASQNGRSRFLREARTAASVKHDHIVTIYQVDEDRGVPFMAMELLEGESLEKRLARDGKVSVADIIRIGREIAEGLAAAHQVGLVHRDIKPANIWLESIGDKPAGKREQPNLSAQTKVQAPLCTAYRVKILDFGLAYESGEDDRLTRKGVIVGTAAFMSPEQAKARTPDHRGDLFSLGCVLYSMCTGKLPHRGSDFISTLVAVVSQPPRPVDKIDPSVPGELASLIMQLLEKDPANRPQSARAVAKKLAEIEKNVRSGRKEKSRKSEIARAELAESIKAAPGRPLLKRPSVLLSMAAVLALLCAGGAWLAMGMFQSPSGVVMVKSPDKNVRLKISGEDNQTTFVDLSEATTGEISLKVGKYDVDLVNAKEGLKLKSRQFVVLEGKQCEIEVVLEPKLILEAKVKETVPPADKAGRANNNTTLAEKNKMPPPAPEKKASATDHRPGLPHPKGKGGFFGKIFGKH